MSAATEYFFDTKQLVVFCNMAGTLTQLGAHLNLRRMPKQLIKGKRIWQFGFYLDKSVFQLQL